MVCPEMLLYFLSERLRDIFLSRQVAWFFLSQEVALFFCPEMLRDLFVSREVA